MMRPWPTGDVMPGQKKKKKKKRRKKQKEEKFLGYNLIPKFVTDSKT